MAWNEERARKRVANRTIGEIVIKDLVRERDLSKLGSNEVCRANAAHIYADVANFHLAVDDAGGDKEKQKKLVRAASVLRRIQRELVADAECDKIQMQAARFHGLCYKPYDDEAKRAKKAVCLGITLQSYLYDVFNGEFTEVRNFQGAVGIDAGRCLIANIGYRGDRQLISLGTCANVAAKCIGVSGSITVTKYVYDLLPECLKEHFKEGATVAGLQTYKASGLRWKNHPELAEELGVKFDEDKWRKRTKEEKDDLVLADMNVTGATALIDPDQLSERASKRVDSAAIYVDVDGFTKYVQDAEKDDDVKSLVQTFHMLRAEFQSCIEVDYDGLALQHQGDCVLAIVHLPAGDDQRDDRSQQAVDVAIAVQSSMERVLREKLGHRKNLHVAVGVDIGRVLVTRLGKKGKREVVCLSPKVTSAQDLQMASSAEQIRISADVYDGLDDELKDEFVKSGASYVATGLTFPDLDEKQEEKAARSGRLGATIVGPYVQVTTKSPTQTRPWSNPVHELA